ncbi:unnamed protein product [Paramecium sonneborni]|uniref:Transmembrane protein n=1 Tax=Paramecium sonneborni TaxID=65129 RepID=A0A8S1R366_9CILI|nr:unnamed protein product [Paramecium sonneborni]
MYLSFKSLFITIQKQKIGRNGSIFLKNQNLNFGQQFKSFLYLLPYIFLIVFFYNYFEKSSCDLIYLCQELPLKSNYEYIKLIFRETILFTTIDSFLIYSLLICFWIHISLLITLQISFYILISEEEIKERDISLKYLKLPQITIDYKQIREQSQSSFVG